jgi:hypothetical protein
MPASGMVRGWCASASAWPPHWQVHCYSRTSALKLRIAKLEKDEEVELLLPSGIATAAPGMPCPVVLQPRAARHAPSS